MWWKLLISFVVITNSGNFALADCPSADLTDDCFVDYDDFAVMAAQWLTGDPNKTPADMANIPVGAFVMGDHFAEGDPWELPLHAVLIDSFFMSKYKITNQQYCDYLNSAEDGGEIKVDSGIVYALSDSNNSYPYCNTSTSSSLSQIDYSGGVFSVRTKPSVGGRDMLNDPMVDVSWYGAAAYCNWRSSQKGYQALYDPSDPNWPCDFTKKGYRLPTEAEWEYAARGGLSSKRFPLGDTISHSQANYWSSVLYPYDVSPTRGPHPTYNDGIYPYTAPVDSFPANGYGLYGMTSNTRVWCNDWYNSTYYSTSPYDNPQGPAGGTDRVLRGGNWSGFAEYCRVAYRLSYIPGGSGSASGFRVVLDLNN